MVIFKKLPEAYSSILTEDTTESIFENEDNLKQDVIYAPRVIGRVKKRKLNPQVVTIAVIERNSHILIAKRKRGKMHAGNWEFPGGTVKEGETYKECLKRELEEELAITSEIGDLICSSEYNYTPDWTVKLLAYRAAVVSGSFKLNDHEDIRWVRPEDLTAYEFPEVDWPVIEKLISESRRASKRYTL
jgi:8-oxo-dGTP diphosphatase